jgi:hypothetical protein
MRRLVSALALVLLTAGPASAFLVEVTTSVAVTDADDQRALQAAITEAVDGARLYIRLLVADSDGERTFDEMQAPPDLSQPERVELKI